MMASGEIRLSSTTMRQMPVLAQSQKPTNPCSGAGNAPSPQQFAAQGQAVQQTINNTPPSTDPYAYVGPAVWTLLNLSEFHRGGSLDAQAAGSSTAYANYVYGDYLSALGFSLPGSLSGANAYASAAASYPANTQMSPNYPSTPAVNVANITAGFNAQQNGSLCTKP
jgi:hypothetical protein